MKPFSCNHCDNTLYFENDLCLRCNHQVGFDPYNLEMISLVSLSEDLWAKANDNTRQYRSCLNAQHGVCNWLIDATDESELCISCRTNGTIPNLSNPDNLNKWKTVEMAKHRLIYALLRLGLPVIPKAAHEDENSSSGLRFDYPNPSDSPENVITGHKNGIITINLDEANEIERVINKIQLGEQYRTLIGHFRHEVGHYYWQIFSQSSGFLERFREVFGDERQDYQSALKNYYSAGPPANWADSFISSYATAHPWEDWAETWAHYLHMMDTIETAHAFHISIGNGDALPAIQITHDPYFADSLSELVEKWIPLTNAINSMNRSMGHADFYPFVVNKETERKMDFIHQSCRMNLNQFPVNYTMSGS